MRDMIMDLQNEITKSDCDVVNAFRKAHLIASRLKLTDADRWIQYELNGYPTENADIPEYRNIQGVVKSKNPINGWIPVIIEDQGLEHILTHRKLHESIGDLVQHSKQTETMYIPFPGKTNQQLSEMAGFPMVFESALFVTHGALVGIIEKAKNQLWEWTLEIGEDGVANMDQKKQPKLFDLMDSIPEIKKAFKVTDIKGFPRTESIYSEPIFISWSEEVKSELRKLRQDELIKEVFELFSKFTGWTDKRLFETLAAKLEVIKENYSGYILDEKSDAATRAMSQESAIRTAPVTNYNFYGDMSGSNIATGNQVEQEMKTTEKEEKSWMEKYGIAILVALIGVAGTIIAAIIGG